MSSSPEDQVSGDETVFRTFFDRVDWWNAKAGTLTSQVFEPSASDTDGLSVIRSKSHNALDAARLKHRERIARKLEPEPLVVAEVSVGLLLEKSLSVVPDPLPDVPGHALIPEITIATGKGKSGKSLRYAARACVVKVHGPFQPHQLE